MSSISVEMNGAFAKKIDLTTPSKSMRELMVTEAERWREMEKNAQSAKKSLSDRLASLFSR
jgi:hypothetical protein